MLSHRHWDKPLLWTVTCLLTCSKYISMEHEVSSEQGTDYLYYGYQCPQKHNCHHISASTASCSLSAYNVRWCSLYIPFASNSIYVFPICFINVVCPLIFSVNDLNKLFWQKSFKVSQQYQIIFAMEIDPTGIAFLRVSALLLMCESRIEYIIQRMCMDVAKLHIEILA